MKTKHTIAALILSTLLLPAALRAGAEDEAKDAYRKASEAAFRKLEFGQPSEKIEAIIYLGGSRNTQAVRGLGRELVRDLDNPSMRRLPSNDPYVKSLAAWALARIKHPDAVEDLLTALEKTAVVIEQEAARNADIRKKESGPGGSIDRFVLDRDKPGPGLFRSGEAHPFPASPDVFWSEADEFKSNVAIDDTDEAIGVRLHGYNYLNLAETILFALGEIGGEKAEERLLPFLENKFPYLRGAAAVALGRIATTKALAALEQRMAKEDDKVVRARMCFGLLVHDKTRTKVYLELLDLLRQKDVRVRLESAASLRDLSMGESAGALRSALALEENSAVRSILVQAITNADLNNILPAGY